MGLRVFSILTSIILARLLDPADFGQVGLAQVVLSIVAIFSTLGLPAAVIQTTVDRDRAAFSSQVVVLIMGVIVCATIVITAPWLGFLLGDTRVEPILQWLSVSVLLGALTRIPEAMIQKELLFGRLSLMGILTEVGTVGMSIGLALLKFGVWSLVYGAVFGAALNAVLAWAFLPGYSWLKTNLWDRLVVRHMLGFGARMVGSTTVYTFYSYVDNYVVGRLLGTDALGYYGRAFDLTSKTVDSVNRTIGVVLFPSYAQVQHDRERLTRAYLKSLRMIGAITIPLALGLFAVADEFVPTLLGDAWRPAIPALKVLTFMSLLKPLSSTTSALFISTGHPHYNLRAGLAVTAVLVPGMLLLLPWGIVGVAYAVVIAHAIGLAYNVFQVQTILPRTVGGMAQAALPSFGSSVIMAICVMGVRAAMPELHMAGAKYIQLGSLVAAGVVVYLALFALTQRPLMLELFELIRARGSREN